MNFLNLLRKVGLLPHEAEEQRARAITENAVRDNEQASSEVHRAYCNVNHSNEKLRKSIRRNSLSPFGDLERMMHGDNKGAGH